MLLEQECEDLLSKIFWQFGAMGTVLDLPILQVGRCAAGVIEDCCLSTFDGGFEILLCCDWVNALAGSGNLLHCGLHACVGKVIHDSPTDFDGLIGCAVNVK